MSLSFDALYKALVAQGVPTELARREAEKNAPQHQPTPNEKALKVAKQDARQKATEQHRREFRAWCRVQGLPNPTHELRFAKEALGRGWRFDWSWPHPDVGGAALEIEGGLHLKGGGRHNRPKGYENDAEKYSYAATMGWVVIRRTWANLYTEETAMLLREALGHHS